MYPQWKAPPEGILVVLLLLSLLLHYYYPKPKKEGFQSNDDDCHVLGLPARTGTKATSRASRNSALGQEEILQDGVSPGFKKSMVPNHVRLLVIQELRR